LQIGGQQIWLGPALAGRQVTIWAGETVLHILLDGTRLKTLPPGSGSSSWRAWPPTAPARPGHRRSGPGPALQSRSSAWSMEPAQRNCQDLWISSSGV